jgi:hypothetical protein
MREIARIRNEHSVEVLKLRKNLEDRFSMGISSGRSALTQGLKENATLVRPTGSTSGDFEIEKQRRHLIQENEILSQRVRALEQMVKGGTTEKAKFTEGAKWIAKKTSFEAQNHYLKIQKIMQEFNDKAQSCVTDERIPELDARSAIEMHHWLGGQLSDEMEHLVAEMDKIFSNVDYCLSEAIKRFRPKKE